MSRLSVCILMYSLFYCFSLKSQISTYANHSLGRPSIGLVLSGGGAKGFAHVGVLKVIDSLNIPVDYIVGTSMGSIIGGLYAMGYSGVEIERLIIQQDWERMLTDKVSRKNIPLSIRDEYDRYTLSFPIKPGHGIKLPKGLIQGQNIINAFRALCYRRSKTGKIEDLPIKYVSVATDLVSGKEVVIDSGDIADAMRASMSIPYVFAPVDKDEMLLVDGGLRNNFPANIAKRLGADIIIGIDVQKGLKGKKEIQGGNDMIDQAVYFLGEEAYAESMKCVDVYIKPAIDNYKITDFYSYDSLIQKGEDAAWHAFSRNLHLLRYSDSLSAHNDFKDQRIYVRDIKFSGLQKIPWERVRGRITFMYPGCVYISDIEESIDRLYGTLGFETVTWRLEGDKMGTLVFIVKERLLNTFNIGLHFDTWENASLLLNTTFRSQVARRGSRISLNLKLSQYPRFLGSYTLDNGARPGLKVEVDLNRFKFYDYNAGQKLREMQTMIATLNTSVISVIKDSYAIGLGVSLKYYDCSIENTPVHTKSREKNFLLNYFAYVRMDTREKSNFARSGIKMNIHVQKVTDNGWGYRSNNSLYAGHVEVVKPINFGTLTFIPQLYMAGLFGSNTIAPIISYVSIGGIVLGNDLNEHIPFVGLRPYVLLNKGVIVLRGDFQWEMWKRNYLIYRVNVLKSDDFTSLKGYKVGMGLTFAYESVIGPIEATMTWSKINDGFGGMVNVGYWF